MISHIARINTDGCCPRSCLPLLTVPTTYPYRQFSDNMSIASANHETVIIGLLSTNITRKLSPLQEKFTLGFYAINFFRAINQGQAWLQDNASVHNTHVAKTVCLKIREERDA